MSVDILIFDHRYITDIKSHRSEYQKWENKCIEAHRQMQTVPKKIRQKTKTVITKPMIKVIIIMMTLTTTV